MDQLDRIDDEPVNVEDEQELADWLVQFGCTAAALREAVAAVGTRPPDVERYLAAHVTTPPDAPKLTDSVNPGERLDEDRPMQAPTEDDAQPGLPDFTRGA